MTESEPESFKTGRVLVTGASGFTGNYLCPHLEAAGYDVVGTTLGEEVARRPLIHCDLLNSEEVVALLTDTRPEFIIHLAGISFVPHVSVREIYEANLLATVNLLENVRNLELMPQKLLIASSANVYGNHPELPIVEGGALAPTNAYGNSKLAMERALFSDFTEMNTIVVRPFNYTGVGQAEHFLVPKLVRHFAEQRSSISLGALDVRRDISDVRDIVELYRRLLEAPSSSEIVNVCSGVDLSVRDLVEMLQEIAGYEIDINCEQDLIRSNEIMRLVGSTEKLERIIDRPQRRKMKATLEWMHEEARRV